MYICKKIVMTLSCWFGSVLWEFSRWRHPTSKALSGCQKNDVVAEPTCCLHATFWAVATEKLGLCHALIKVNPCRFRSRRFGKRPWESPLDNIQSESPSLKPHMQNPAFSRLVLHKKPQLTMGMEGFG